MAIPGCNGEPVIAWKDLRVGRRAGGRRPAAVMVKEVSRDERRVPAILSKFYPDRIQKSDTISQTKDTVTGVGQTKDTPLSIYLGVRPGN